MIDEDEVATGEFELPELDEEGHPVLPVVDFEWFWRLEKMVRDLQARARFRVDRHVAHRPVPDVVRDHMESASGLKVSPTVGSLYSVTDGFELAWSLNEGDEWVPGGQIQLFGFAEVFGSWLNRLWDEYPEGATDEEIDFTWDIRGFDGAWEGDDHITVLHVPEILPRYHLYWHSPTRTTYRLRVDFLEYLECLTETRGLCGWQYMVCDRADLEGDDEALERIAQCTRRMRSLFPDVDLSRYTTVENE